MLAKCMLGLSQRTGAHVPPRGMGAGTCLTVCRRLSEHPRMREATLLSGVDPGYRHYPKHVTPGTNVELPGVALKWYDIHVTDKVIPADISRMARVHLEAEARAGGLEARGLGFVELHRCGEGFYFLIVCTWLNSNELWTTVYYKDGVAMPCFSPWPRERAHKPALCVWELAPVWHEQQSWVRFLESARDEVAVSTYLGDRFAGPV